MFVFLTFGDFGHCAPNKRKLETVSYSATPKWVSGEFCCKQKQLIFVDLQVYDFK